MWAEFHGFSQFQPHLSFLRIIPFYFLSNVTLNLFHLAMGLFQEVAYGLYSGC